MKSIKYLVMLACMTLGLANIAKAQIYSNEIYFYQRTDDENRIIVVKFDGSNKRLFMNYNTKKGIQRILEESINRFEDDDFFWTPGNDHRKSGGWKSLLRNYDYDLSTSSREVYKGITDSETRRLYGGTSDPYDVVRRYAFSKDLSSLVFFSIDKNVPVYYIRVDKEDLLPKALNPNEFDFLNE